MNLQKLKEYLLTVSDSVYHFTAPSGPKAPYIVWAEDGENSSVWADDIMRMQIIEGTVDLFTKIENDPIITEIQKTLNGCVSWRLNSIQYEEETNLIHYEWLWEIEVILDG